MNLYLRYFDKETLVHWNELLLEEGVSKAWALLIDYLKIDKYQFEEMDTNIIIINRVINSIATNPCVIFASSQYTWEAFLNRLVKRKKY